MPIYEFYCRDCHTLFSFLSRAVDTSRSPACPSCGRTPLERRASAFAVSRGRPEPAAAGSEPDLDDARMERAMAELAREAEGVGEDNPRAMARLMRRFYEGSGLRMGSGMEEAMRRMEAGEDPDAIEREMGDVLEDEDPFAGGDEPALERLRRRLRPARIDTTLYEM
jgi:putative FmdB family regulatory protein